MIKTLEIRNNERADLDSIPIWPYEQFFDIIVTDLMKHDNTHCVNYFGYKLQVGVQLFCCIADDNTGTIHILSSRVTKDQKLNSISAIYTAFHVFERELHENFGLLYSDHPWLKPIRYPWNRTDKESNIANYPFYTIESDELHEVGVGPIHAGIIEPGHFRFICNGEQILHLEIQLGFQHRGIEQLFIDKKQILQRATLAENITGDTVIGHGSAFAQAWESLCGFEPSEKLLAERALAAEIERVAIHTGDLSAICTDIAYQLGSSVFGRLRTPIINFFQHWCGNRLAKSLMRPGKTNFPFDEKLSNILKEVLASYKPHFVEMANEMFDLPSVLSRLERTGVLDTETAKEIGVVGMAAKSSNLSRDIRASHPYGYYKNVNYKPIIHSTCDVYARTKLRYDEIIQSLELIQTILNKFPELKENEQVLGNPRPNSFVVSLTEGWRGEICHCAITDEKGELILYKIKDPSLHNWMALALAVRKNEISDFPVCNKSFNLSYCGNDL